ncbi:hypothetical protein BV898_15825 [Hypsibius exemplaris]|uniref:Uncharacterized protein n=1 Tax=Hypsibius exemplaris TaxID=2072580 RepID=A0A9X6NKV9_HYPEX|nr:hypothetical protein BV898_15825 [Hypsibius exemplaris]
MLDEMNEPTTGLKNDLIERIIADQVQNPDVTLPMDGPSVRSSTSAPVTGSSASSVAVPLSNPIAALVHRFDLRPQAITIFEAAAFTSSFDVELMSHEVVGTLDMLFADFLKIQN